MNPAVIDTTVLIDHLRGAEDATRLLADAREADRRIVGSVVTRLEVLSGMRAHERRATLGLLASLEWIPVTVELADAAAALARRHRPAHPGIKMADFVIAATVRALDAELWTRNVRHFPMLRGLAAPY